jgi:hypothetical protein
MMRRTAVLAVLTNGTGNAASEPTGPARVAVDAT